MSERDFVFCVVIHKSLESLTPAQKTSVTKSSTERLRLLLLKSGYAEEIVLGWSRKQLMNKYAELLSQGWDPAVVAHPVDPELEKIRLAHEKDMKEMELELERQRNAAKEKERELREKELVAEKERKELREKELEAEKEKRQKDAEEKQKERDLRQKIGCRERKDGAD